jgi:hypothetical protein
MPTAEETLTIARSYLEQGPQSFWDWYPAPAGTAWCCIAQSRFLTEAGIPTHYAWVSGLFDQYRSQGRTFAPHEAQPGDLVAFDYDGNGPSSYDHIAMVESVNDSGIVAINGNWSGKVSRVLHRWDAGGYSGGIAEIARPAYSNNPEPEDDDMKSVLMIDRRQNPAPVYHAFGNTKVWLSKQEQVDALRFLGAPVIDPAPPAWLDALATIPRG